MWSSLEACPRLSPLSLAARSLCGRLGREKRPFLGHSHPKHQQITRRHFTSPRKPSGRNCTTLGASPTIKAAPSAGSGPQSGQAFQLVIKSTTASHINPLLLPFAPRARLSFLPTYIPSTCGLSPVASTSTPTHPHTTHLRIRHTHARTHTETLSDSLPPTHSHLHSYAATPVRPPPSSPSLSLAL